MEEKITIGDVFKAAVLYSNTMLKWPHLHSNRFI
jgi:hypothetical protein